MVHEWNKRSSFISEDDDTIPPISSEDVYGVGYYIKDAEREYRRFKILKLDVIRRVLKRAKDRNFR
ncbi:MAG: hypothetical protein JSV63_00060 [Candidatus Aenigmatarchaeota archaeon]|nr:MAG: hypothetical protein JSV63_00060 [Candidatus Aenigmarchaeota archaeon]